MKAKSPADVRRFEDIPNVGPRMAADFRRLGIARPQQLSRRNPYALYYKLMRVTGQHQDPCVCDTFIAAVRFMQGEPPRPWWHYTPERKRHLS